MGARIGWIGACAVTAVFVVGGCSGAGSAVATASATGEPSTASAQADPAPSASGSDSAQSGSFTPNLLHACDLLTPDIAASIIPGAQETSRGALSAYNELEDITTCYYNNPDVTTEGPVIQLIVKSPKVQAKADELKRNFEVSAKGAPAMPGYGEGAFWAEMGNLLWIRSKGNEIRIQSTGEDGVGTLEGAKVVADKIKDRL